METVKPAEDEKILQYSTIHDPDTKFFVTSENRQGFLSIQIQSLKKQFVLVDHSKDDVQKPQESTTIVTSVVREPLKLRTQIPESQTGLELTAAERVFEAESTSAKFIGLRSRTASKVVSKLKADVTFLKESPPFRMPTVKHFWAIHGWKGDTTFGNSLLVGCYDQTNQDKLHVYTEDPNSPGTLVLQYEEPLEVIDFCSCNSVCFMVSRLKGVASVQMVVRKSADLDPKSWFADPITILGVSPISRDSVNHTGNSCFGQILNQTSRSIVVFCDNNTVKVFPKDSSAATRQPTNLGKPELPIEESLTTAVTGHADRLYVAKILDESKQVIELWKEKGVAEFEIQRIVDFPDSIMLNGMWATDQTLLCQHITSVLVTPRQPETIDFKTFHWENLTDSVDNPLYNYEPMTLPMLVELSKQKSTSMKELKKYLYNFNLLSFQVTSNDLQPMSKVEMGATKSRMRISDVSFRDIGNSIEFLFVLPHFTSGKFFYSVFGKLYPLGMEVAFRPGAHYGIPALEDLNLSCMQSLTTATKEITYMMHGDYYQHVLVRISLTNC